MASSCFGCCGKIPAITVRRPDNRQLDAMLVARYQILKLGGWIPLRFLLTDKQAAISGSLPESR